MYLTYFIRPPLRTAAGNQCWKKNQNVKTKTKSIRSRPRLRPVWDRSCHKTVVSDPKTGKSSATTTPKSLLLTWSNLTWNNAGKMGRLNKNQACVLYTYCAGRMSMMEIPVSLSPFRTVWMIGEAPRHLGRILGCTLRIPLQQTNENRH